MHWVKHRSTGLSGMSDGLYRRTASSIYVDGFILPHYYQFYYYIYIIMGRMMDLSNTDYGGLLAKQFSEFL